MDDAEREICTYLKGLPDQFISAREICRRAGGKWRFREDDQWAIPLLPTLVQKGLLEQDVNGHYRAAAEHKDSKRRKPTWIAPHIQKILQKGGVSVNPASTFDLGNPDPSAAIKLQEPAATLPPA